MQTIVLEVSGGVVHQVYADTSDVRVILLDWDAGERPGDAFVGGEVAVAPLSSMSDTTLVAFSHLLVEHMSIA